MNTFTFCKSNYNKIISLDPGDSGCKTQFSNYTWSSRDHLLSRKLDKGSSNKPLCVYGCAAGEKSCYSR
ncbi:hypothetical protein H8356DRAFT_1356692 [Neocallimastix lanati (nom. inval.)]|nr:hypothetical protein H8356DRAFT_1356692 [Neocallimastix sp. JGI-2020a]